MVKNKEKKRLKVASFWKQEDYMKCIYIKDKIPLLFSIVVFIIFIVGIYEITMDQTEDTSVKTYETVKRIAIQSSKNQNEQVELISNIQNATIELPEYQNLIKTYKGYTVIGKIHISKLEIEKYILAETSQEALKVAVTKLCGPRVNEIGNFCIAGHNYPQTFGKLKELEIGDEIKMTDTYDRTITYKVYQMYKVDPTDTTCLNQQTQGEREITLITCTLGAIKRNIIKAIEVYD